ncbi:B3/B4 domain-containing protein [Gemella cuniculi]|uniref:B3/B4 domain-containing protein n=1 Tax=Gemella cuniculi TaxID=150240 RepID=UPI0003FB22D1|nr:phenylalanine--tRNA ligase beta subunit-related protein [Gemella cuniculi]
MTKKIIIDKEFLELFPNGAIYLLELNNIDNRIKEENIKYFNTLINNSASLSKKYFTEEIFSDNEVIKIWREAFSKFKTKKGARSSIEALLKRTNQGRVFNSINPLVDIYNSISLEFALPCGGEDIDNIDGNMHLGKAKGGESFLPLGETKDSPALPEEIIYYDNSGAICRSLNWREAQRTMLTPETKNAIIVIETINEEQQERAEYAISKLSKLSEDYFKVEGKIFKLTKENTEVVL